jgi:Flp pilus assembly pilin Flp
MKGGSDRGCPRSGQSVVEYAIILALVAIAVIAVLLTQGETIAHAFSNVTCGIQNSASPPNGHADQHSSRCRSGGD